MKEGEKAVIFVPGAHSSSGDDEAVEVELLDFLNVFDLRGDGVILKKVLTRGFGYERCGFKDEVKCSIRLQQDEKVLFESPELTYVLNNSENLIYEILKTMKIKEEAESTVEFAHFKETHTKFEGELDTDSESGVVVYVNVVDMIKVEDMYLDGTFYKRLLVNGEGKSLPNTNAIVRVYYKLTTGSSTVIDNTGDPEPFQFVMDGDTVPSVWIHCLRQMKEGDVV
jgi:FKBP-type peptidyl-prolyl cis-trans isomerase